jgi:hypothetical protein
MRSEERPRGDASDLGPSPSALAEVAFFGDAEPGAAVDCSSPTIDPNNIDPNNKEE